MTALNLILIVAGAMLAAVLLTVLAWLIHSWHLDRLERRLAVRKGLYREVVSDLSTRDRALLHPSIHQLGALYDLDALEAVLEEQARGSNRAPGWLLDAYDELGLVDKYINILHSARKWRDRALAAELLGRIGGARAVPALIETVAATRTEDADVREVSLRALARITDTRAVEPLIRGLETAEGWLAPRIADILARHGDAAADPLIALINRGKNPSARAWAANALGEIRALHAFPTLVHLLGDPEAEVRAKAATALGRLGDRRAIEYLLEHLLTDPSPFVRARIATSLGLFGGTQVVDSLVRSLGDSAWWVRMRSVEALAQIGTAAEGSLLVALDDADPEVRARAAVALERLGVTGTLVRLIESGEGGPEVYQTLDKFAVAGAREFLAELTEHHSSRVRSAAVTAIHRAERRDLSDELIQVAAADAEAALRALALTALNSFGIREALPAAHAGLVDQDQHVRAASVALIGRLGGPRIEDLLREQTTDAEPAVRAAAVGALGAMGGPTAEADVDRLLQDPDAAVRGAAVDAAADFRLRSLVPGLIRLLDDNDPTVRCKAALALGVTGHAGMVPMLLRAFPDTSDEVSSAIAAAVSRLDPGAVGGLVDALLGSPDVGSKLTLIDALRRSRSGTLAVLQRLRSDPSPAVRAAAIQDIGRQLCRAGGDDGAAVATIKSALEDLEELVRARALDAWTRIAPEDCARVSLTFLEDDPSPLVRERAALAVALLQVSDAGPVLLAVCRRAEPANVRAAAALAIAGLDGQGILARVAEMPDQVAVRELMCERLRHDARFRLLRLKLSRAHRLELRALASESDAEVETSLVAGLGSLPDSRDRLRLISSLTALHGEQSRGALLQMIRADPIPEVRTAALAAAGDLLEPAELLATASRAVGDPSVLVRRAAVALFTRVSPHQALPRMMQALRVNDDPAVLAAVAAFAENQFDLFTRIAHGFPLDGERALLVVRIARHMVHPDLPALLRHFAASGSPDVRAAVAELWTGRPEIGDPASLVALTVDPDVSIRRSTAAAVLAAERYDLLETMAQDPDPSVRREVALILGRGESLLKPGLDTLESLGADPDMPVRAAAYVSRLLRGSALPLPPELDSQVVAQAVRESGNIPRLRETALTSSSEEQRLAAAMALALLQDDVAREVARTDPAPSIRHRVSGALELSIANTPVAS
jgi:HEAT repeat protein